MRVTYGLFLELSVDKLLPGFFDSISEYPYSRSLDRGSFRLSLEFGRVEVEGIESGQSADVQLAVNAIWRRMAGEFAQRNGITDWESFGRITVRRVEDVPQPSLIVAERENPAVLCPKCESPMVARSASRSGAKFYGCSKYPRCGGTRPMSP